MNDNKKIKNKRPLSHKPLLNFQHDDNFLYDKKFMNEELWQRRFNLKNLRKKWDQKVKTNFLKQDVKFGPSLRNPELNKVLYHDSVNKKDLFSFPTSLSILSLFKYKKSKFLSDQDSSNKYNDKISYYLSNKNPWNNRTSLEVTKEENSKKYIIQNVIKKNKYIRNKIKNCNESKNISVRCIYYNDKYLHRKERLKELINKFCEDTASFVKDKYIKELKLKKHGKQNFIKDLILKHAIKQYKELYEEIINKNNTNIYNNQILKKNNSEKNIFINKNENKQENKNIYEQMFIIINFLKENKSNLNNFKDKTNLIQNYFDILEMDEILKDKDINYIKFIKDFGINDTLSKKSNLNNYFHKSLINSKKRNKSSLNISELPLQNRKFSKYNVKFFHPGTYYLFNENENEYHAWSCCMNDDKNAKGCCKRVERIPFFIYE